MRFRHALLLGLLVPTFALGQAGDEAEILPPTGGLLLRAAPRRADLLIHTPNLPALLASAAEAHPGSVDAWRKAFDAQLTAWGSKTGAADRLRGGGRRLLKAADGEFLLAALTLPTLSGPQRTGLMAFRSSQDEETLMKALRDVVDAGLFARFPSSPTAEEIHGRSVLALRTADEQLFIRVQDGLVAAADHPLALGLFFRGMEDAGEIPPAGERLFDVRHGSGADAWTGWNFAGREAVSWNTPAETPSVAPLPPNDLPLAVAVALPAVRDVPLFPVSAPDWLGPAARDVSGDALVAMPVSGDALLHARMLYPSDVDGEPKPTVSDWVVVTDGDWNLGELTRESIGAIPGGARPLGWLAAYANGAWPMPIPGVDPAHLARPLEVAQSNMPADVAFEPWRGTEEAGELRGDPWTGPATFLLLRTLHDIAHGVDPRAPAAAPARVEERGGSPLPPPSDD